MLYMLRLLATALPPCYFHLFPPLTVTFRKPSVILRPLYTVFVVYLMTLFPVTQDYIVRNERTIGELLIGKGVEGSGRILI
jgi:hypothetical protein